MANRGNTWTVPAGMSESFDITVQNQSGPITGQYAGNEPLPVTVWEGSNLANLAGVVSCRWISGPAGTVQATVAPPSGMAPGYYRVRIAVTYGGATSPIYYGWLKVDAVPGTAAEAPTYCSLQDLVDLAGEWLEKLMQSGAGDQTNFLRERAMAREWLDDAIIGQSRVFAFRFDLTYALYYGSFPFGPVEAPDTVVAQYLASNYLQITPRTIECCGYRALFHICEKRQTFDEAGEQYRQRALYYKRMASNSLRRYRPTLDTNADGKPDIAFNLGVISFR
jgi:hypothetical protein